MGDIPVLYGFVKHAQSLKSVERAVFVTEDRKENSAEHSWSVATMAWILLPEFESEFGKKIDSERLIKMSLMHDLVEMKTGDASVWDPKKRRRVEWEEKKKFKEIASELPVILQDEMLGLWNEFIERETLESRITHGVDRLSAALQRVTSGQGWTNEGHSESDLDKIQLEKISFSAVLKEFYETLKSDAKKNGLLR